MAFNGSGVFNRLYSWVTDRNNSVDIDSTRMDAEMDGMATGLSNCITKDGQTTITANLPMATYRHTGVGNASARTDYAAAGQVQDSSFTYAADSGAADAYVITLSPAITAYAAGQEFKFLAGNANTGTSTLNVNGLGAKTIKKNVSVNLSAGDIQASSIVKVIYDGTNFQLLKSLPKTGNFTPALWDGSFSSSESQTYNTQTGYFYRDSEVVHFGLTIDVSSEGTLTTSDPMYIGDLPYTVAANKNGLAQITNYSVTGSLSGSALSLSGLVGFSQDAIIVYNEEAGGTDTLKINEWIDTGTGSATMTVHGWYITDE